jgi:hypothetical protein
VHITLKSILFVGCLGLLSCQEDPKTIVDLNFNQDRDTTLAGFDTDMSDDIAAYKTVVNVIRETGLSQNFVILPGDVSNVQAYMDNNERILEYNPDFMEKLQGDTNWHGISVLARQIGHHLSNAKLEGGVPTIEEEIEADKYAGFVLYKMGASLEQAVEAMEIVISEDSLGKGISRNSRLVSLTKGWNNADVLMSDTVMIANVYASVAPEVAVVASNDDKTEEDKPEYVYKVFLAIEKTMYFVNKEDMIFTDVNGKVKNVGLKKESNKPGFDWIFVKDGDSYGVDKKGKLWAFSTDGNFHVVGQAIKLSL